MKNELTELGDLYEILAKAELAKNLLSFINEEDTKIVVEFLLSEKMKILPELDELSFLRIQSTSDPIEFGQSVTLHQSCFSHSWAGGNETKTEGVKILGNVFFGESTHHQYSENGDHRTPEESYTAPEFSIDTRQVVFIRTECEDSFNGRDDRSVDLCLHIYQPNNYILPEWVQELVDKFGW